MPYSMNELVTQQKHEIKNLTSEQIDLVKKTVAKNATNDELQLFLHNCNRLGLDPFAKQIHFVKYGGEAGTIIVGIDGFRLIASRTGKLSGIKRGALKDKKGMLVGAWAEVYRSDWTECAREEVPLKEYDKGSGNWRSMPETMIKKVAEVAALRMAFPADLSGVYSGEEMDQATPPPPSPTTQRAQEEQPAIDSEVRHVIPTPQGFVCGFGKFKGMLITDVPKEELSKYILWLTDKARLENKPIQGQVKEFIEAAEFHINGGDIA